MTIYKLYPEAEIDLEKIWQHTVREWSTNQAFDYLDNLESAFQLLADFPLMSRERHEFSPAVRIHHHEHHLIVYLQEDYGIAVIRVLHESMDVPQQLGPGID